jgi:hypothetical protein
MREGLGDALFAAYVRSRDDHRRLEGMRSGLG